MQADNERRHLMKMILGEKNCTDNAHDKKGNSNTKKVSLL